MKTGCLPKRILTTIKKMRELGSGHTVTALYEVIPIGVVTSFLDSVDALKYQKPVKQQNVKLDFAGELMNIKLRYKQPNGDVSKLLVHPVMDADKTILNASSNMRFAAAVAQFGMLLRNSEFKGSGGYELVKQLASNATANDLEGYRKEFVEMVSKAKALAGKIDTAKVVQE